MFRFAIRDVLWLTVVVAMGVGWWVDRKRADTQAIRLRGQIENLNAELYDTKADAEKAWRILGHTVDDTRRFRLGTATEP